MCFVISGYVINSSLRRLNIQIVRDLTQFYWRRFLRLGPALSLMAAVSVVLGIFLLSPIDTQNNQALTTVGALMLCANIVLKNLTRGYFAAAADTNPLLHTWSLSVEEQFYVMLPLVLLILAVVARLTRSTSHRTNLTRAI